MTVITFPRPRDDAARWGQRRRKGVAGTRHATSSAPTDWDTADEETTAAQTAAQIEAGVARLEARLANDDRQTTAGDALATGGTAAAAAAAAGGLLGTIEAVAVGVIAAAAIATIIMTRGRQG